MKSINNLIVLEIKEQSDGYWYGRIIGKQDEYGNEIDSLLSTPSEVATCLIAQWGERL